MKKLRIIIMCVCIMGLYSTAMSQNDNYNGHEYVDLGLPSGLKWATCNVGAEAPEESGDYFSWGETAPKNSYSNSITYDVEMEDISGNAQFDAATANWGGAWRMPTQSEMSELVIKCTREWTTVNGVEGYKFTGPNGNSIFLPATGYYSSTTFYSASCGYTYYWSSTPIPSGNYNAYYLKFVEDGCGVNYSYNRDDGYAVRPVAE